MVFLQLWGHVMTQEGIRGKRSLGAACSADRGKRSETTTDSLVPSSAGATTDRPEPLGRCGLAPSSAGVTTDRPEPLGPCG